ncbi:MAG: HDIG domain-containing protein, partial [Candidatus Altiarchaeota archaeon]|nr:HDIG domain-containing protein [Candidatus Altiarchaeota archaeon]
MEEQIRLAFRTADSIIEYRMEDDAFKTQYYVSHGNRVSELAEQAAIELGADPLVCKLAGKFHDIGYSSNSENSKEQHIKKGVKITRDVLSGLMMPTDYVDRVVSCVQTHDDSFDEVPSIENLIVNDVDVLVFFDSLKENIALIVK